MTLELLRALLTIVDFCRKQPNCKECALRDVCGRMPCEL